MNNEENCLLIAEGLLKKGEMLFGIKVPNVKFGFMDDIPENGITSIFYDVGSKSVERVFIYFSTDVLEKVGYDRYTRTIRHEVAHAITRVKYGSILHCPWWHHVVRSLGDTQPSRYNNYGGDIKPKARS